MAIEKQPQKSNNQLFDDDIEEVERKCPECGSTEVDLIDDELICRKCGLVIE